MQDYVVFATSLAHQAGDVMREHFLHDTQTQVKADKSLVTIADIKINQLVIDAVAAQYPGHSVLAEEKSALTDSTHVWVCDPIDGTYFFAHGIALGTFMLTLVIDGEPKVAVIYEPITNRLYHAIKGEGAYCNTVKLQVNTDTFGAGARIDVSDSKSHAIKDLRPIGNILHDKDIKIECIRATGLVGSMVATGALTAALYPGKYPHDVAAIKLIVEEAGGRVTDLNGQSQRYDQPTNGAIISNGLVHDELIKIITQTA